MQLIKWDKIASAKIAAIEFAKCDRLLILSEIFSHYSQQPVYFWNQGYKEIKQLEANGKLLATQHLTNDNEIEARSPELGLVIERARNLKGVIVLEGIGKIEAESSLAYQLENFFFDSVGDISLLIIDDLISVPTSLYPMIPITKVAIPDLVEIENFLWNQCQEKKNFEPASFLGLSYGEINLLLERNLSKEQILIYKTEKLAIKGIKIIPEPDVNNVGGLDLLLRDLNKIKKLFTPEAKKRGLKPPKGCLMWGLPGTGKSLTAKILSQLLNVPLIFCDWNQLISHSWSKSLQNLDFVLDLVDRMKACILFFDEFEKAFSGWAERGILAKLAGKLLSWMQDSTSSSIMLATINRLEMLPPELIRRFEYIWFFDLDLHNGAMYEIFKLHLEVHFPGFAERIKDEDWYRLFEEYRMCSPSEIAVAIKKTHHEIFYQNLYHQLSIEILIKQLILQRYEFTPAINNRNISDALAQIRRDADFGRPVRGKDRSRFAVSPRGLFEPKKSELPINYSPAI